MALDFPNSPTNGQTFTSGNRSWTFNGTRWEAVFYQGAPGPTGPSGPAGIDGSYSVSDTAPSSPSQGQAWFDTTDGRLYIYFNDVWIEPNSNLIGPTGPGVTNYIHPFFTV